jgi:thioredoxin reductase (NADPH)
MDGPPDVRIAMTGTESVRALIIGGGPAGYTAAIYAARAGLEPVCVEGYNSGGQVIRSGLVHNFPGHPDGIAGEDLADRIRSQAIAAGARIVTSLVESIDHTGSPFVVATDGVRFSTESVIVATGAEPRRLGLASEDAYEGRGVCYCAICDGPFFRGKRVAVVGGGDTAAEEALTLSGIADSVLLIHRRAEFRASAVNRAALAERQNITVLAPAVVTEVLGDDERGVTGVTISDATDGTARDLDVDGLFVAIGHTPATSLFHGWLDTDPHGCLITEPGGTATSVPGVFAAGDVTDSRYRQAVTAAAAGCAAAMDAERWLRVNRLRPDRPSTSLVPAL